MVRCGRPHVKKTKRVSRERLRKQDSYLVQSTSVKVCGSAGPAFLGRFEKSRMYLGRALLQPHLIKESAESGISPKVAVRGIQFEKNAVVQLLNRFCQILELVILVT